MLLKPGRYPVMSLTDLEQPIAGEGWVIVERPGGISMLGDSNFPSRCKRLDIMFERFEGHHSHRDASFVIFRSRYVVKAFCVAMEGITTRTTLKSMSILSECVFLPKWACRLPRHSLCWEDGGLVKLSTLSNKNLCCSRQEEGPGLSVLTFSWIPTAFAFVKCSLVITSNGEARVKINARYCELQLQDTDQLQPRDRRRGESFVMTKPLICKYSIDEMHPSSAACECSCEYWKRSGYSPIC